jgi:DNA-binding NtrC family response regulator
VFTIQLPPLRERPEDVALLARHFAEQYAARAGASVPDLDPSALERLTTYGWPGNVRELKNAIERAALVSGGETILAAHLPPQIGATPRAPGPQVASVPARDGGFVTFALGASMTDVERDMIRSTLAHTAGNKTRAAKILGISLKTMHNKVKKYGL